MKITTDLTPHYKGLFEVFRTKSGEQYARLRLFDVPPGSYIWFKFDFLTETYQNFDSEMFPENDKVELQKYLETEYEKLQVAFLFNES
jgi:hypothetical protein